MQIKLKAIMMKLLLVFSLISYAKCELSALKLAENLEQVISSSTLEWVPVNSKQPPKNLSEAVVGAYQIMEDEAEEENSALNSLQREPVYICRAKQNGIWVPGQLRPNEPKCIVSLRGIVDHFDRYELLINTEGAGRLSWVLRTKFTLNPQGGVTSGDQTFRTFIARRNANSHNKEGSLTHFLGKFDPADNLGKYTLVDQNDEQLEFEDGEILVETEPQSYEIKNIVLDYSRKRVTANPVVLGRAILKNEYGYSDVARVDAVITYNYNYTLYWGHGHGLLTGLPLTVQPQNSPVLRGRWGISDTTSKSETRPIEGYLQPGTAVNVTLRANYDEWDTPYSASVVSHYKDGERRERVIRDNQREHTLRDIIPDFGPVYFLHNKTLVPTTTTTTTTTTTRTTTTKLTTTTEEAAPLTPPQVLVENELPDEDTIQSLDGHNVMMDEDAQSLQNKEASEIKSQPGLASSISFSTTLLVFAVLCARKIT